MPWLLLLAWLVHFWFGQQRLVWPVSGLQRAILRAPFSAQIFIDFDFRSNPHVETWGDCCPVQSFIQPERSMSS